MIRRSWRTLVGVTLGVVASVVLRNWAPSVTFPRGPVNSLLLGSGFAIPDAVYNNVDYAFAAATPVLLPVVVGVILCVAIAGVDVTKRGLDLGVLVACINVAGLLAILVFMALARGLTFPLLTWFVRAFIQPVVAVAVGGIVGAATAAFVRLVGTTRRRVSSSL
jgi:hypothetical protein